MLTNDQRAKLLQLIDEAEELSMMCPLDDADHEEWQGKLELKFAEIRTYLKQEL